MDKSNEKKLTEKSQEQDAELSPQIPDAQALARIHRKSDVRLPASIVGGLVGMLIGTLPEAVWFLIFRVSSAPMFVFLPLLVYLGIRLFKGYDGRRGLVALLVLSLAGFFLTLLSVQAAAYVLRYQMFVLSLPLVTVTLIGQRGILTGSAISSAYILPLVFWLLGVFLGAELLMEKKETAPAPEPKEEAL